MKYMITDSAYLALTLMQLAGIGRKTLLNSFDLSKSASLRNASDILAYLQDVRKTSKRIREFTHEDVAKALSASERILEDCQRLEISITAFGDENYPLRLKAIDDPPVILYSRGRLDQIDMVPALAIIGTREPTDYGYRIAKRLGAKAAEHGILTVSGLAIGCDTGGHVGTLDGDGATVAVLANGLDTIYPAVNAALAERILGCGGCLISEYAPFTEVQKGFFVDRDRLQAGLSDAVFVVETGTKGGTLHTVEYAKKYERLVFCFGHPENMRNEQKAQGNLMLINDGIAVPVSNKAEIEYMIEQIISAWKNTTDIPRKQEETSYNQEQITLWDQME